MNIALKEWSSVIAALDRGAQIFLLRKGGLVEARRGFELKYAEFLLYPTAEHQHARYLKPEWTSLLVPDTAGAVSITHFARVTGVLRAPRSPSAFLALSDQYVWNEDFIRQRYTYRPDLPLHILIVRACRLEQPRLVFPRPSYAGCKSWVPLTEEIPTDPVQPVLSDAEFAQRYHRLRSALDGQEGIEQATE